MAYLRVFRGKRRWQGEVHIVHGRCSKIFPDDSDLSKRQAENWEDEIRNELRNYPPLSIQELVENYLEFAKAQYLENTYQEKKRALGRFERFFGVQKEVKAVGLDDCLKYLQGQVFKRGGNAANRDRKELGAAWEWGKKYLTSRFVRHNPWHEVRKWKCEQVEKYIPSVADFQKVVDVATGQDKVMLLAFQHTAARRSEIFQLKWSDIGWEHGFIRLWTRKRNHGNREFDWLPMTQELNDVLTRWWIEQAGEIGVDGLEYVFVNPRNGKRFQFRKDFLKNLCLRAGVKRFSWHSIRHMSARNMYRHGATFGTIQTLLRHKSPKTTSEYLKKVGDESARKSMNELLTRRDVKSAGPNCM